jgi:hypothetical protein
MESDDDEREKASKAEDREEGGEDQALKYFNTAAPEALQELTGQSSIPHACARSNLPQAARRPKPATFFLFGPSPTWTT